MSAVIDEMAIDLNNLDKSSWKTHRFDEIAQNISERVDPNNTDLTVYIGLEHLDSGSIHIKRSGTPDDVNGQKLRFYKGDVIFGRRRAYQRKAGVATTDGFCSAHALVLRANPEVIDPELFPFFLHSDLFMNLAVDISVGSLSPTINWGNLKEKKFRLPPKKVQKKLADLLKSKDLSIQKDFETIKSLQLVKRSIFNKLHWLRFEKFRYLEELCSKITSGGTPSRDKQEYFDGDIPWVKTKELNDALIESTEESITKLGLKNSSAKILPERTILLAMYGVTVGKLGLLKKSMTCNQACCALIVDESKVDHWFLFYYLMALRERLVALSVGSAQPNISAGIIKKLKIPDISLEAQKEFSNQLRDLDTTCQVAEKKLSDSMGLLSTLLNRIF